MNDQWTQRPLFNEPGAVVLNLRIGIHQESERLIAWLTVTRSSDKAVLHEGTQYLNFTENGLASAVEYLWDAVYETIETHGLIVKPKVIDRISAPF